MASTELDELRGKLDARIAELEKTQKQLKHPSTISFAERRELSANAGKALAELREQQAALGGDAEATDAAAKTTALEAALERAAAVLGSITAAQPAGAKRATGAGDRRLPGQQRRGAAGASQQRAPERKGGE